MNSWLARAEDTARHLVDLRTRTYEGAEERGAREAVFRRAFALTTPVALRVLSALNRGILNGTGSVTVGGPERDGAGGLFGHWEITWPLLEQSIDRFSGAAMPPVRVAAIYPADFSHGHLAVLRAVEPRDPLLAWPFQVTTEVDAERQEAILWTIAEGEVHERVFRAGVNWRVLPQPEPPDSWGAGRTRPAT
ncbi:MAG: hypothetical protein EXR61_02995 [Chloroflexi bacterium]|nr:hypothetical protein [Chloroflexota bacterium]